MNLHIAGKHIDTSAAYQEHVERAFKELNQKFSIEPVDVQVTISKSDHHFQCDIHAHIGRGIFMRSREGGSDAYVAFDNSLNKLSKILLKHKQRIRDHHQHSIQASAIKASQYVLSEETHQEDHPTVIAEMQVDIPYLTVGEAVMRLELQNEPYFLFYNKSHGRLNLVHFREDGNIGWIDPSLSNGVH